MGWKLATVVTRAEGITLQAFVDAAYGPGRTLRASDKVADKAMNPELLRRYAMTFGGFHWIFDWGLVDRVADKPVPIAAKVWAFGLHSVVNGYSFSVQENGKIIRARNGDGSDARISLDIGVPSATERALVAKFADAAQQDEAWHVWTHADATFDGVYEGMTHDHMGEDVVFGLLAEATGVDIMFGEGTFEAFAATPVMEIVRPPGLLARLFGGRRQ